MTMEGPATKLDEDFRSFLVCARECEVQGAASSAQGARMALGILSKLPIARDAVMELFSKLFARVVERHVELNKASATAPPAGEADSVGVEEDVRAITAFIDAARQSLRQCPSLWSPILSAWSLRLLGQLSGMIPKCDVGYGVNDQLQSHMECVATRVLLELAVECFHENLRWLESEGVDALCASPARPGALSAMAESGGEKTCLRVLIDVSDKCGDQFDWVIGHLGGKYPTQVIPHFLEAGLRVHFEFFQRTSSHGSFSEPDSASSKKLRSVGSVLDHLSLLHYSQIVESVFEFAQNAVRATSGPKTVAIPYLLVLGSKSHIVRQVTSDCLGHCLDPKFVLDLSSQSKYWFPKISAKATAAMAEELWDMFFRVFLKYSPGSAAFWTPAVLLEKFGKICSLCSPEVGGDETVLTLRKNVQQLLYRLRNALRLPSSPEKSARNRGLPQMNPFFVSLREHWRELLPLLFVFPDGDGSFRDDPDSLDPADNLRQFAMDLTSSLAIHDSPTPVLEALTFLLTSDSRRIVRETAISLAHMVEPFTPRVVPIVVKYMVDELDTAAICDDTNLSNTILVNLLQLMVWEKEISGAQETMDLIPIILRSRFADAVAEEVMSLSSFLWGGCDPLLILEILVALPLDTLISRWTASNAGFFVESVVEAFFRFLDSPDGDADDGWRKLVGVRYCNSILSELIPSCREHELPRHGPPAPGQEAPSFNVSCLAVRCVVERAFSAPYCACLGGSTKADLRPRVAPEPSAEHSLMDENLRMHSSVTSLVRTQSTLYKSANLCSASRRSRRNNCADLKSGRGDDPVDCDFNCGLVIEFLETILEVSGLPLIGGSTKAPRPGSWKYFADLFVEFLAPDVMFSGVPWPDEDTGRLTIERDLEICRRLNAHPISWHLLFFIARNQSYSQLTSGENDVTCVPPICYCSVILRAITCVNLHHWSGTLAAVGRDCPTQAKDTKRLLSILSQSNLCPPPLSYFGDVLDVLPPAQIRAFLSDLWAYLREMLNTPISLARTISAYSEGVVPVPLSPAIQNCVQRLRLIFLANMHEVGPYYSKFFGPHPPHSAHLAIAAAP